MPHSSPPNWRFSDISNLAAENMQIYEKMWIGSGEVTSRVAVGLVVILPDNLPLELDLNIIPIRFLLT